MVNVQKGQVEVKRMSCPGSRITCQTKIGNTLWMATEVLGSRTHFLCIVGLSSELSTSCFLILFEHKKTILVGICGSMSTQLLEK